MILMRGVNGVEGVGWVGGWGWGWGGGGGGCVAVTTVDKFLNEFSAVENSLMLFHGEVSEVWFMLEIR